MELSPCKFCGQAPWYEVTPQYEDETVTDIYTYLQCPNCRAHTIAYLKSEQAVEAWEKGEYNKPGEGITP